MDFLHVYFQHFQEKNDNLNYKVRKEKGNPMDPQDIFFTQQDISKV